MPERTVEMVLRFRTNMNQPQLDDFMSGSSETLFSDYRDENSRAPMPDFTYSAYVPEGSGWRYVDPIPVMEALSNLPYVSNIREVTVTIGGKEYQGALYLWKEETERFYLLSETLPPGLDMYQYQIPGDLRFWYFAGHTSRSTAENARFAKYHPCGPWFMLSASPRTLRNERTSEPRPIRQIEVRERVNA